MTSAPNLFPDYPVARLGQGHQVPTVMTVSIEQVKGLVADFLDSKFSASSSRGLNIPVRGEFGTGKTHLLAFASEQFAAGAADHHASACVITAAGLEAGADSWYRLAIGPQLVAAAHDMLLTLFAEAAKSVAMQAPLTSRAVSQIEENPRSARMLVQRELLSPSSVDVGFIDLLERTFGEASVEIALEVRRALVSTVWRPTISQRWLGGGELSELQQMEAGLPATLATDDLASDAIVAVAAVAKRLGVPLALVLDELEHVVRFDQTTQSKRNITWLKRLLERLVRCGALVLVAGQSAAWQGQPDFLDRFSPGVDIELLPLAGREVMEIVETIQGDAGAFNLQNAERVAELSEGNIRRILGTLRSLFSRTSGFSSEVTEEDIDAAAAALARRVDPERALADLARMLRADFGLRVEQSAAVAGKLSFDLIAYRDMAPLVVVELKDAPFGQKQQDQVQRFIDKMRALAPSASDCIGCFLSASPLDESLQEAVTRSDAPIVLVDLTEPGFLEQLRGSLEDHLRGVGEASASGGSESQESDTNLEHLATEIQTLKDDQATFYTDLQERLARGGDTNVTFQPAATEELQDVRRRLYEEFSAPPRRARWLSQLVEPRTFPVYLGLALGVALIILSGPFASSIANERTFGSIYSSWRAVFLIVGFLMILTTFFGIARLYVLVDRFYSF